MCRNVRVTRYSCPYSSQCAVSTWDVAPLALALGLPLSIVGIGKTAIFYIGIGYRYMYMYMCAFLALK